jgi:hypothetical protein
MHSEIYIEDKFENRSEYDVLPARYEEATLSLYSLRGAESLSILWTDQ